MSSQPRRDVVYGPYPLPYRAMPTEGHQTSAERYARHHEQYAPLDTMTGYGSHPGAHLTIHEPSSDNGHAGSSRRRIQVACTRCRRRKIKCTGDPGDGTGCQACRSTTRDISQSCNFRRVGSEEIGFHTGTSLHLTPVAHHRPGYVSTDPFYAHPTSQVRTAVSVLQNRATIPSPAHAQYHTAYSAGTANLRGNGRHGPTAGAFQPSENIDPNDAWARKPVMEMSSHNTSGFYDIPGPYELGSLHTPLSLQIPSGRVTSMAAINARSPLDMGSLELSLPVDSAHQRPLPTLQRQTPPHNMPVPLTEPLELHPSVSGTDISQLAQIQSSRRLQVSSRLDPPAGSDAKLVSMDAKPQNSYSTAANAASRHIVFTPTTEDVGGTQSLAISDVGFEGSPLSPQTSKPSLPVTFQTTDPVVSQHHDYYEQIGPISDTDMNMTSHEQSDHELALFSYSVDRGERVDAAADDQSPDPHPAYTEAETAQSMP